MTEGRKLIVAENMTINGVIDHVDDWFDPGDQLDEELLAVQQEHMATEDALILGRKTFEAFRGYWPLQLDDTTGFTAHLNKVHKYVFSTTITEPGWENTTILQGSIEDEVRRLKAQAGGDIGVTGSIEVVHALVRADLVDEYRLFVYPTAVGSGRRLVPEGTRIEGLKLVESRPFPSDVILLNYTRG